jgi:hypothetical protein
VTAGPLLGHDDVLTRLQRGLETLYRIETHLDIRHYIVSEQERCRSLARGSAPGHPGNERRPREQLLVSHADGELSLGLYLDAQALANLERHDPGRELGAHNFDDFCLAVEGVSHFIYVAQCAAADRAVTALELELQAEVDKFVSCVLLHHEAVRHARRLRAWLFDDVSYANDLGEVERSRYQAANREARQYAGALERRYLCGAGAGAVTGMVSELRHFYRLPLEAKLGHIARTAA